MPPTAKSRIDRDYDLSFLIDRMVSAVWMADPPFYPPSASTTDGRARYSVSAKYAWWEFQPCPTVYRPAKKPA